MHASLKIVSIAVITIILSNYPTFAESDNHNWAGIYLGFSGSYGWTTGDGDHHCIARYGLRSGYRCQLLPVGSDAISSAKGALLGFHIGFNEYLDDSIILGMEADISVSNINGNNTVQGPFPLSDGGFTNPTGEYITNYNIDWFGTIRSRLGYQFDPQSFVYMTGGLAFASVDAYSKFTALNVDPTPTEYIGSLSSTEFGWTAGLGAEFALDSNLSVKVESLYYDLGEVRTIGGETPLVFLPLGYRHDTSFDLKGGIIRIGLSHKF